MALVQPDNPRLIARDGQAELVVKKSRFIGSLFRVETEEAARGHLDALRKQRWDANHNCSAWIIGEGGRYQRSNDDGEPSGTAGVPMLEVLRRRELTNVLAVVTRYFGGIMLGASGLIRAYGQTVSDAVDQVGIVELQPLAIVDVHLNHNDAGRFENALRSSDHLLSDVTYAGSGVTFSLQAPPADLPTVNAWINEQSNGRAIIEESGVTYVEVAVSE